MTLILGPSVDTCFVDKRRSSAPTNANPLGTPGNYKDEASLDTRLAAISATAYSAANLRVMTTNDKVYALRLNDDAAGI
jgi:hypothetical protein